MPDSNNKEDKVVLKPTSFRLSNDVIDKFKKIASELGKNQQDTMIALTEAYELQVCKNLTPNKKTDIEKFESYQAALTRLFISSLEDNSNLTETIKEEFRTELNSKDNIIKELQQIIEKTNQQKKEDEIKLNSLVTENNNLNSELEYLKNKLIISEKMLKDKENLNSILSNSLEEIKQEYSKLEEEIQGISKLKEDLNNMTQSYNDIKQQMNEMTLNHKMELLNKEQNLQEKLNEEINKYQKDINVYQSNYKKLLEELQQYKTQQTTINNSDKKNTTL